MKLIVSGLLSLSLAVAGSAALAKGGKKAEVEVLHQPPSESFLLTVPVTGLHGHLNHGDCLPDGIPGGDRSNPDPELNEAVLDAAAKAGADLNYIDGCVGEPEPPTEPPGEE